MSADDEVFLASYGDTLTDAPLPLLIAAHAASGKVASLLATKPNYTFNVIASDESDVVTSFDDIARDGHVDQRRVLRLPPHRSSTTSTRATTCRTRSDA